MEDVTKIDVINDKVIYYDENSGEKIEVIVSEKHEDFLNEFLSLECFMVSINISEPIARVVQFLNKNENTQIIEMLFVEMSEKQKDVFNKFINL